MTFASRMQHKIYWGPLKKPIEWSLKTVLAPWAYIASVIYHDSFWYPVKAKTMMREVLDSAWGRLFRNWERVTPDAQGYPNIPEEGADDPADGLARAGQVDRHPGDLHQGSAGVRQPAAPARRLTTEVGRCEVRRHASEACSEDVAMMADVNVRSDAVDVEQIMRQIRARIREKRGADYTEAELQQLANVKLEKFLDPRGVRSDLVEQFRAQRTVSPAPPNYEFEETTLYETHRGVLRALRKLLRPLLKLFFNPDTITTALHVQAQVNTQAEQRLRQLRGARPALLRAHAQPRRRDHAARHRGPEPEDARRVAVEPHGFRRAARAIARERRAVPAGAAAPTAAGSLAPAAAGAHQQPSGRRRRQRRARRPAGAAPAADGARRRAAAPPAAPAAAAAARPDDGRRLAGRLAEPEPRRAGCGRRPARRAARLDADSTTATESADGPVDADGPDGPDASDQ